MLTQAHPPLMLRLISIMYVATGLCLMVLAGSLLNGYVPALLQPWLPPTLFADGVGVRVVGGSMALLWGAFGFALTGIKLWQLRKRAYSSAVRIHIVLALMMGWYTLSGPLGGYGLLLVACNAVLLIYLLRSAVRLHFLPDDLPMSS